MDSYTKRFKSWMEERGLTSESLAPLINRSKGTVENWRSQRVPDRARVELSAFMEHYDADKAAALEKLDKIALEIPNDRFERWNQAALDEGLLIKDWMVKALNEAAKAEFSNVADFPIADETAAEYQSGPDHIGTFTEFRFVGSVAAGQPVEALRDETLSIESGLSPENHVIIEINGESGGDEFPDGSRWLVETFPGEARTARKGKPAVFQDSQGCYLKVFKGRDKPLVSVDPSHDDVIPSDGLELVGYPIAMLTE